MRDRDDARNAHAFAQQRRRRERAAEIAREVQRADEPVRAVRTAQVGANRRQQQPVAKPRKTDVDTDREQRDDDGQR